MSNLANPRAETLYGFPQPTQRQTPLPIIALRAPTANDTGYPIGQPWIYKNQGGYELIGVVQGQANWQATSGSGSVTSIAGTANQITATNTAGAVTLSLPAAITAPGSLTVTSGFTVNAGTSRLDGAINLNTQGGTTTNIGSGGSGVVNIGNGIGNVFVTGTLSTGTITAATGNISTTTGSITSATTLTATLGAITATNGNLVLGTAGNKIVSTSVGTTAAAGANSFGSVTLVNGTATVATTAVTASSLIHVTRLAIGTTGANPIGDLSVGDIIAGTSFVIGALSQTNAENVVATDQSVVYWSIVN